jgi:V-type H+-transporting ATPase subunit d
VKLVLSDTDYAQAVGSLSRLTRDTILAKVREKYVAEFFFLRSQASGPLATFLDFLTYEHLIDSFSFLVSGLINGSSAASLLAKCHPLGDSPFLKSILMFDAHDTSSDPMVRALRCAILVAPRGL